MSIYQTSTLGTQANLVRFNDYTSFPIYRVQSRQPQQRQIRDYDLPVPFESGISDFETLIGKTAYVIEGTVYPDGEAGSRAGMEKLRKLANLDVEQTDVFTDSGYVPYTFLDYDINKQIFMKVLYVDMPENTRQGLVQNFRLVCKVKDPTIYSADIVQANTGAADFTAAKGSAVYSFAYPIVYGSSTTSVSTAANNQGDTPVYPIGLSIFGPVNNPRITNLTTGEFIQVNVNMANTTDNLLIQYDKDSLSITLNGVSQLNNVTNDSSYFKIQPGSNIFQLTGASVTSGSYAVVSFYSGWSLG